MRVNKDSVFLPQALLSCSCLSLHKAAGDVTSHTKKLFPASTQLVLAENSRLLCSCEASTKGVATCGPGHSDNWQWSAAAVRCGAQRAARSQLQDALRNRWVVVAGDSITRFFYAALLRALTDDGEPAHSSHPCLACCSSVTADAGQWSCMPKLPMEWIQVEQHLKHHA